jgi:ribonuclease BN (tRNA processing enzyme)
MSLCESSDVLIHDAQLVQEELAAEGYFGHAAGEYAVVLADRCGVSRVVLFHHKPDRTDEELDAVEQRFASSGKVMVAAQSTVLEI